MQTGRRLRVLISYELRVTIVDQFVRHGCMHENSQGVSREDEGVRAHTWYGFSWENGEHACAWFFPLSLTDSMMNVDS